MSRFRLNSRRGFTLIEIMIVVLIIAVLLAIAIPNFMKARDTARAKACMANLRQIDTGKQQLAMDNKLAKDDPCAMTDLVGPTLYIKVEPTCPSSGTYTPGVIDTDPICSLGTSVTPPHVLVL